VEFIREIPVTKPPVRDVPLAKAVSPARSEDNLLRQGASAEPAAQKEATGGKVGRPRGKTESAVLDNRDKETAKPIDGLDRDDEEDPWPVEWIMVTRSDPGGSIPRWMVEKGTPKSICTDAVKFVDWACRDTTTRDKDERYSHERESSEKMMEISSLEGDAQGSIDSDDDTEYEEEEHHGLIASFAYLLNAGLERYAPKAVLDYLPHSPHRTLESSVQHSPSDDSDGPSEKEPSSNAKGVTEGLEKDASTNAADAASQTSQPIPTTNSVPTTPLSELAHDSIAPVDVIKMNKKGKLSSHEKQLAKLAQRKREVEAQLETIRNEIQTLQLSSSPEVDTKKARAAAAAGDSSVSDQASISAASTDLKQGPVEGASSPSNSHHKQKTNIESAHMHKVASGLFQQEAKLLKQLGKIEKHQLKEASKIEAQQRKNADREEKSRFRSETDALRREVDTLKKEVERLRSERQKWLDLVASLQAENTRLVARQGGSGDDR
jgi:hypothetical protein